MLNKLKQLFIDLGSFGPLLAFAVAAPGAGALLLAASSKQWLPWIQEGHAFFYYILFGSLLAGLSFIPTHGVSLIGGLLFGSITGSLTAIFTILLASILSFYITGILVSDKAVNVLRKKNQANQIYLELLKASFTRTTTIIALVRLSPIMPFAGTNVLLGAAKVNFAEFTLGSIVGLAPRIILVVIAGAGLDKLDFKQGKSHELLIIGMAATIVSLIVIGRLSQKALQKLVKE